MEHRIAIEKADSPKMDWDGDGYRYVCTCGRKGTWWGFKGNAERSGNEHVEAKNPSNTRR